MLSVPSAAATVAPEGQGPSSTAQPRRGARRKLWFFAALASFGGLAAAGALRDSHHASPEVRSGSPGYRKAKSGQTQHWQKKGMTIYLDESVKRLGPHADDAVQQAFGRWLESDERLPNLSFDTGETTAIPSMDGKSTVSYGRITAPGHEKDLAITVTYANDDSGEIIEADIVLNSMYPIGVLTPLSKDRPGDDHDKTERNDGNKTAMTDESEDCQNRYDVQNVVTHEAGHFFGLGEDLTERGSTMFQTIDQCETHKRLLSGTDTLALANLYAAHEDPEEAAAGPKACSFVAVPAGPGSVWAPSLLLGLLALRRRRPA
jgi:hypothetical protein